MQYFILAIFLFSNVHAFGQSTNDGRVRFWQGQFDMYQGGALVYDSTKFFFCPNKIKSESAKVVDVNDKVLEAGTRLVPNTERSCFGASANLEDLESAKKAAENRDVVIKGFRGDLKKMPSVKVKVDPCFTHCSERTCVGGECFEGCQPTKGCYKVITAEQDLIEKAFMPSSNRGHAPATGSSTQ